MHRTEEFIFPVSRSSKRLAIGYVISPRESTHNSLSVSYSLSHTNGITDTDSAKFRAFEGIQGIFRSRSAIIRARKVLNERQDDSVKTD